MVGVASGCGLHVQYSVGDTIIIRPLNLPGQFIVRATHFHSEIGQSHSEIPAQSSHNARFMGRLVTQLGMDF